jgi:predicted RNase H-like HicB family nuclease
VSFPDVPGCISAGDTLDEALASAAEALVGHLALLRADGDAIPAPRSIGWLVASVASSNQFTHKTIHPSRIHSKIEEDCGKGRIGFDKDRTAAVVYARDFDIQFERRTRDGLPLTFDDSILEIV